MGVILSLLAAVLGSSKDLLSKKVSFGLQGGLSAFASFLFALPFYFVLLAALYLAGLEDFAFSWAFLWLVVLRSLTDAFAEYAKMSALACGDISLVGCFIALLPFFLLITSPLITGDVPSPLGILAVVLTAAGALCLVYEPHPGDMWRHRKTISLATLAAVLFSLNCCFDRLAVQIASPALSGFAMTLLSAMLLGPACFKHGARQDLRSHQHALWGRGFLEVAFMVAKLTALQHLQAPYVMAIAQISLILSVAGGRVLFDEGHFRRRLLAGGLIVGGAVIIAVAG